MPMLFCQIRSLFGDCSSEWLMDPNYMEILHILDERNKSALLAKQSLRAISQGSVAALWLGKGGICAN